MNLPPDLRYALESELRNVPVAELTRSIEVLSNSYRRSERRCTRVASRTDVLAYGVYRLPATYGAAHAALTQVQRRMPGLRPRSLLDVGAGLGSATWAALDLWPEIDSATLIERDERMIDLGKRLGLSSEHTTLRQAAWNRGDVSRISNRERFDLVIASYLLGEIDDEKVQDLISTLWVATSGVLMLVEPGTPAGFSVIRSARQQLIEQAGHVVAPCPHDQSCPMAAGDWCHFSQRVPRSRIHRQAKRAELGYEDEKFSYVAVTREGLPSGGDRVIRHPAVHSGHVRLELCTIDGLEQRVVSRKEKQAFRRVRDLKWGDAIRPD